MTTIKNFLYKIYGLILNNPFCSALILLICLVLKLNLHIILIITFIIAVLAVLSFNKRFSFLQSSIFIFFYLVFEILVITFVMKNTMFASLTLIYQGLFILIAILLRALSVFLTYYLTNIILFRILNSEKIKNFTQNFVKFFRQDSFVLILLVVLVLCSSLHYSVKYFQTVPVKVSSFAELKENYNYGFKNEIYPLKDDKLCFKKHNQIIVYDLKNHEVYDKFTILDFNNIFLENTVIKVRTENRIFPLSNGNILIQQNYIPEKRKDYDYNSKTYIKIYSPKKGEISSLEIPFVGTFVSLTELPDNKILFIGNKTNQTFIYDINNNTYYRSADMNYERSGASAITLNDERVFVFSGQSYPNNCVEIYDVQKDTFEKIPLNFKVHNYINTVKLSKLKDGRILIQCEKAMENKNDGIGNSDGFRSPDGNFITVYPVPCLTIFNPQDNSFEEIDINKNSNKIRIGYDTAVLKNGNIIIVGGGYIDKNTQKKRNRMKKTKDILVYNPQKHTIKKTFRDLKYDR